MGCWIEILEGILDGSIEWECWTHVLDGVLDGMLDSEYVSRAEWEWGKEWIF